jgi:hypothetical protein
MKSKRKRLPVIEAFLLTGLLLDFLHHASLSTDKGMPIHLARATLGHKSVRTIEHFLPYPHEKPQESLSHDLKF